MTVANVLIAYASMSGNTEDIAQLLKVKIEFYGHSIDLREIELTDAKELLNYDAILIGSYTWGDGDLPYEAEDFYKALSDVSLLGKKAAVFGSGDTAYPQFCAAVDLFENRLKDCGAELVQDGLRIEFTPYTQEDKDRCEHFAIQFANAAGNETHE